MNLLEVNSFNTNGYSFLGLVLDEKLRLFFCSYALEVARKSFSTGDSSVPDTACAYSDPMMESLLEALTPRIESASGLRLFPTYSYLRMYKNGDSLRPHKDRPACEVSVSMCLAYEGEGTWPLWIDSGGTPVRVALSPGEAVIYKGTELSHWRDVFQGRSAIQVFLHYVNRDGQYKEWRYDKRERLGSKPEITKIVSGLTI